MPNSTSEFASDIHRYLKIIYQDIEPQIDIDGLQKQILGLCHQFSKNRSPKLNQAMTKTLQEAPSRWSQQDVILITYGDSIREDGVNPLETLNSFAQQWLQGSITSLHILPFFPFSSDDGFSVIDYRMVNPDLGNWDDIQRLNQSFDLMVDLVINHCSRESLWFSDYVADQSPYNQYFIEVEADTDVSQVTRPRNTPLLAPVHTHRGIKHLWATFSADQIDLNFANPRVLVEFIDIYLFYIQQGARFIRLDAVAFLWKQLGTRCLHLPQTHAVVKLFRTIIEVVAPEVILITETNVPVAENLSYFGQGDEAQMVYQFGLPPLILHALNRGNSRYLTDWAAAIPDLPEHCTYLNFTASHDGIGVRPVEGLLPDGEVQDLIESMHKFGGFVSMKENADGTESPYEINITLFDACMGTRRGVDHLQVPRFLCSQTIMLAMKGIPAVYIHSMMASANDLAHVEQTGRTRSINRRIWQLETLTQLLENPQTAQYQVYQALRHLLQVRKQQPAFHPDAKQSVIHINSDLFILQRRAHQPMASTNDNQNLQCPQVIYAINNITDRRLTLPLSSLGFLPNGQTDVISGADLGKTKDLTLEPYQCLWLTSMVN